MDEKQACRPHLKGRHPRSAADCKHKHNLAYRIIGEGKCTISANCQTPMFKVSFLLQRSGPDLNSPIYPQKYAEGKSQSLAYRLAGG